MVALTRSQRAKPFRQALEMEIASRLDEGGNLKGLRKMAAALLTAAEGGDIQAIKEVADRLDGKVAQAIVGDAELDPLQLIVTGVPRREDDPEPRAKED